VKDSVHKSDCGGRSSLADVPSQHAYTDHLAALHESSDSAVGEDEL